MRVSDRGAGWVGRGVLALFAAMLAVNAAWLLQNCERLRPVGKGDLAPSVALPRVDGLGERSLAELRGKVVLVDFWATWCKPCELTVPVQLRLYEKYQAQGFDIWSVNEDQGQNADARAAAYAAKLKLPFPVVHDHDGLAATLFKVDVFPHMVLVDRLGVVRQVQIGVSSVSGLEEDLEAGIRAALAGAPP